MEDQKPLIGEEPKKNNNAALVAVNLIADLCFLPLTICKGFKDALVQVAGNVKLVEDQRKTYHEKHHTTTPYNHL